MTKEELYENAIQDWKKQKCRGTMIVPSGLDINILLKNVLSKIYNVETNSTFRTTIVVFSFDVRIFLTEYLCKCNTKVREAVLSKHINIFTETFFAKDQNGFHNDLVIWYKPFDKISTIEDVNSRFGLVITTVRLNSDVMNVIFRKYPPIKTFTNVDVGTIRTSTPVEEMLIEVSIPETDADYAILKKYDEYISSSMAIFENFSIMDKCRRGDSEHNISATDIAYSIATKNGWSNNLDMSLDYNVQLDEMFNPIALQDRANQTYEIIRARQKLLTDYNPKIEKVYEIVKQNKDKKILVISKRGEFANQITEYINTLEDDICGNFHDKVEPIKALDEKGNPILYKTGAKKGQIRYLGAQAQQSINECLFNRDEINVLSASAAPDKDLDIEVDIIIITSPTCGEIENYLYRFAKMKVRPDVLAVYTIYVSNSIEQRLIESKKETDTHKILNKCEKIYNVENYSDFTIVE